MSVIERLKFPEELFLQDNTRPQTDSAYDPDAEFQWWYFDSLLDNGYRLLTFYTMNAPGIDTYGLNIVLRTPEGELIKDPQFYPKENFKPVKGQFGGEFAPGSSAYFEKNQGEFGHGRYEISAQGTRVQYKLQLDPIVSSFSPLGKAGSLPSSVITGAKAVGGTFSTEQERFRYTCFVPRGKLSGTIVIDGKEMDVSGSGYHEAGMYTFPMSHVSSAWYWLHITHPQWTIITSTMVVPGLPYSPKTPLLKKNTHGGYAYVLNEGEPELTAFDPSGFMVNWKRVHKRAPHMRGEQSMAWGVEAVLRRPGLKVSLDVTSYDVLEYFPVDATPSHEPYWSQTVAMAQVKVEKGSGRDKEIIEFEADAVLETMRN